MPNINQYSPDISGPQPNNLGVSALEQAARISRIDFNEAGNAVEGGVRAVGQQAQNYYEQFAEQPEITKLTSQAALGFANLTSQYNQQINAANGDPNKVGQPFMDNTLDPFIEKLTESATTPAGRDFAEKYGNTLRQHFGQKMAADQVTYAGASATQSMRTTTNALSVAANADPSTVDAGLQLAEANVDAMVKSLGLSADDASKMKTELLANSKASITFGALEGMASKNPEQTAQDLQDGKLDGLLTNLLPDQQQGIRTYIAGQVKAKAVADRAAVAQQQKQQKQDFETRVSSIQASGAQKDGNVFYGPDAINSVYSGPNALAYTPYGMAHPTEVRTFFKSMQTANDEYNSGKTVQSDAATVQDMYNRAALPDTDPNHLTKLEVQQSLISHHISASVAGQFSKMIDAKDPTKAADEKRYNQWLTSVKPLIFPTGTSSAGAGAAYSQKWFQFMQDARQIYDASMGKQGASSADLLNPQSKNYIMHMLYLPAYQMSTEDAIKYGTQAAPTVLSPANGGVTAPGTDLQNFFTGGDFGVGEGQKFNVQSLTNPPKTVYKPGMSMDDLAKAVQ